MGDATVPFVDLSARLRPLRKELRSAFERVLDSGVFVMGPEVAALESEFAALCCVPHAIAVNSGTAALQLALASLGIGMGDEVITVANTFIATAEAITAVGATPVLVDVCPDTYLMDPAAFAAAITERTKAVIPVHLYGLVCEMNAICAIAAQHDIAVIEDACQAHGATYQGVPAGAFGDAACFSFYPAKNLGTLGEGGIMVTRRADVAARARALRSHGETRRYEHVEPGLNLRLSELLAAMARVQLPCVLEWNEQRRTVAGWYAEALRGLPVQLPSQPAAQQHAFHLYVVLTEGRDNVRSRMQALGIDTGIHYPTPIHQTDAYRNIRVRHGELSVTESIAPRLLSLPMFPELTEQDVCRVATALQHALAPTPQLV